MTRMAIDMDETRLQTISQRQALLAGIVEVHCYVPDNDEARYARIVLVAQRFGYARLNRPDKGVVLRYLIATCGYSLAQLTRLLARVRDGQNLYKRYRTPAQVRPGYFGADPMAEAMSLAN